MVNVCGTGGWGGPLPGDPDNNVILSATPAFGGVDVTWTYPQVNSHAVAHVLLYRGTSSNFATAVGRAVVAGNFFYDKVNVGQLYFYWIKIVSINGTIGTLIGPASATARPLIQDLIEELTGKIDQGLLAVSLKTTLDGISTVNTKLNTEIFDRQTGDTSFSQALVNVQAGVAQANTFITTEISSRVSANQALAEQINLVSATLGGDIAAVTISANAWISPLATTNGKVTNIGALYTAKVTVNGLIGGFGIFNDGTSVEAGFDVDTFWVGRTGVNKRKPFIIVGDETFIDQAVINKLTFSKLTDATGTFIVAEGKVQANYIDTKGLVIRDDAGVAIFGSGTALDWSRITGTGKAADNATVGANSSNLNVGMTSGNFISNSGPAPGSSVGFVVGHNDTGFVPDPVSPSVDPWRPIGQGGVFLHFPHTVASPKLPPNGSICDVVNANIRYPVIGEKKYEVSAYVSTLSCNAAMGISWFDSSNVHINDSIGIVLGEYAAGGALANWARIGNIATAPVNAATASVFIRARYLGLVNPYLYTSMWYFGNALPAQTVLSQWTDGSGDITAQNTAKNVVGQGAMATLNFATIGSTVKFGNDEVMQTGDFVNKLSKLSVDNIGTFMDGAAIGKAYIGNAAIETAHIGNLQVSTLKIANDAITVPNGASGEYWAELNMDVGTNSKVAIIATFRQGNLRASQIVSLYVNTLLVTAEAPNSATVASMIHFQTCTGMTKFRISANTEVGDMNCRLLVIGIKK